jgi:hypothetical protein
MMDAASTSEMFVNFYHTTWHNIPENNLFGIFCQIKYHYSLSKTNISEQTFFLQNEKVHC